MEKVDSVSRPLESSLSPSEMVMAFESQNDDQSPCELQTHRTVEKLQLPK